MAIIEDSQPAADMKIESTNLMTEEELAAAALEMQKSKWYGSTFEVIPVERKRFFVMAAIFSLIAFIYTFLRLFKDMVIHSTLEPSAQNWLKILTFPATLVTINVVQKLIARYSIDTAFELGTIAFSGIMLMMAGLMYFRNSSIMQISLQMKEGWAEIFFIENTAGCRGINILYVLALMFNNWIFSFFYICSEVIGSVMVSYLFMTYVNSHCTENQNRRFVRILYIFSNLAGLAASLLYKQWNSWASKQTYEIRNMFFPIFALSTVGLFVVVFALKRYLDYIFKTPIVIAAKKAKKSKSKKAVSIVDGIYYACISKLLLSMSIMTLLYNISTNILTSMFTNSLSAAAQVLGEEKSSFAGDYKSNEMLLTAALVVVALLSPCAKLHIYFGVASSGGLPILISFVGALVLTLFAAINYPALGEDNMSIVSNFSFFKTRPYWEVYANLIVSMLVKVSKYAFFDIVKEAISMKIDPEIRPLFKGVYDGVCGKLGKCAGAVYGIYMEYLTDVRDCRYYAPVTFGIITVFCVFWSVAIYYLHYRFKAANENKTFMSPDYIEGIKLKDE